MSRVNSREVRRVVEEIINESEVKPDTIRFFRGAMFNMVRSLPASELLTHSRPSVFFCVLGRTMNNDRPLSPEPVAGRFAFLASLSSRLRDGKRSTSRSPRSTSRPSRAGAPSRSRSGSKSATATCTRGCGGTNRRCRDRAPGASGAWGRFSTYAPR
jgi:hypothetical protein